VFFKFNNCDYTNFRVLWACAAVSELNMPPVFITIPFLPVLVSAPMTTACVLWGRQLAVVTQCIYTITPSDLIFFVSAKKLPEIQIVDMSAARGAAS